MLSLIKSMFTFLFSAEDDIADLSKRFLIDHKKKSGFLHRELKKFLFKLDVRAKQ